MCDSKLVDTFYVILCFSFFIGIRHIGTDAVKFDTVDFEGLNTDTIAWEFTIFTEGEVNSFEVEWNSAKTPGFRYFYEVITVLTGIRTINVQLSSHTRRSNEERKMGSGEVLVKAILDSNIVDSTTFSVTITWVPTLATITPNRALIVRQGASLTLICSSQDKGNPTGIVVWNQNSVIQAQYEHEVLTIDSIKTADSGTWECYYKNSYGTGAFSSSVDVHVQWVPPTTTITSTGLNHATSSFSPTVDGRDIYPASGVTLTLSSPGPFIEGDSLVMSCMNYSPGHSYSNVLFKVNDIALENLERINSSTYRINSISPGHTGPLKCCYINEVGEVCSGKQNLLVQFKPRHGNDGMPVWVYIVIAVCCIIVTIAMIIITICVVTKKRKKDNKSDGTTNTVASAENQDVSSEGTARLPYSGGITNTVASAEYEYVSSEGSARLSNSVTENTRYMGLDQTDIQRTRDGSLEPTAYQRLNWNIN